MASPASADAAGSLDEAEQKVERAPFAFELEGEPGILIKFDMPRVRPLESATVLQHMQDYYSETQRPLRLDLPLRLACELVRYLKTGAAPARARVSADELSRLTSCCDYLGVGEFPMLLTDDPVAVFENGLSYEDMLEWQKENRVRNLYAALAAGAEPPAIDIQWLAKLDERFRRLSRASVVKGGLYFQLPRADYCTAVERVAVGGLICELSVEAVADIKPAPMQYPNIASNPITENTYRTHLGNIVAEYFPAFPWQHHAGASIFLAGGAVLQHLVMPTPRHRQLYARSDFDLYLVGADARGRVGAAADACERTGAATAALSRLHAWVSATTSGRFLMCRMPHSVIFITERGHYELHLRTYLSIEHKLVETDVDCAALAFDGTAVSGLPRSVRALRHRTNLADPARSSTTYLSRLHKYYARGFAVAFPGVPPDALTALPPARNHWRVPRAMRRAAEFKGHRDPFACAVHRLQSRITADVYCDGPRALLSDYGHRVALHMLELPWLAPEAAVQADLRRFVGLCVRWMGRVNTGIVVCTRNLGYVLHTPATGAGPYASGFATDPDEPHTPQSGKARPLVFEHDGPAAYEPVTVTVRDWYPPIGP